MSCMNLGGIIRVHYIRLSALRLYVKRTEIYMHRVHIRGCVSSCSLLSVDLETQHSEGTGAGNDIGDDGGGDDVDDGGDAGESRYLAIVPVHPAATGQSTFSFKYLSLQKVTRVSPLTSKKARSISYKCQEQAREGVTGLYSLYLGDGSRRSRVQGQPRLQRDPVSKTNNNGLGMGLSG